MKRTETSILQQRKKRKIGAVEYKKKLRSKIPRRKRLQISPVVGGSVNLLFSDNKPGFSVFAEASSSSSCFPDELSCTASWISVGNEKLKKKPRSSSRKRKFEDTGRSEVVFEVDDQSFRQLEKIPDEECRRITRSYYRQRENENAAENKRVEEVRVELSESSCLESFCGVETRFLSETDEFPARNLKLKSGSGNGVSKAVEGKGNAASGAISLSESSCVQTSTPQEKLRSFCKIVEFSEKSRTERDNGTGNSLAVGQNESISEISCIEWLIESRNQNLYPTADDSCIKTTKEENEGQVYEFSEVSRNQVETNLAVSNSESTAEKKQKESDCDVELACLEKLSYEADSYSSTSQEMTISTLESELFPTISDGEFSDNSPWLRAESPSDFSDRSFGNSITSPCFSLFLQFSQQFSKSSSRPNGQASSTVEDENPNEFTLMKFEDEEYEESYRNFRNRERRQNFLHDYTVDYYSVTEYGELVLQQRLVMVNWIVERSTKGFPCGERCVQQLRSGGYGMAGARGPKLPMFLAHYVQLLMVLPEGSQS
ncbi:cyclin-SDS isoform X2 [Macadamia integrifolia]|uniref:cyclin-SDS isoform X2 n=1 Tax=Macadamia integrifolia TaxID=60698 RepID=UPI001C4E4BAD|nr:cyclin-SDS isoform X2 [Macadamia integrifolia]